MPTLIPSKFCTWELSEREAIEGQILSHTQKCVIQNHIAALAKEKIELTYPLEDTPKYWQREAELQGQITFLDFLLSSSDDALLQLDSLNQSIGMQPDLSNITGASVSPFAGATMESNPTDSDSGN